MSTPFMNLDLPSPLVTPGPGWASLLNAALTAVDSHDHTNGQGVPITPAAMNINDDLDLQGHALQTTQLVNLATNATTLATPSIIHSVNGDLVWINANGTAVPITSGNAVVGSPGNIQNLNAPASAQYDGGSSSFRWFSSAGTMAGHDLGFAIFRQGYGSTAAAISLRAPTTGVVTQTIDLPPTLPTGAGGAIVGRATGSLVSMGYAYLDDVTLQEALVGSAYTWRVKDGGITTAKLANAPNGVTTSKINDGQVTTAKLASAPNGVANGNINLGAVTGGINVSTPTGSIAYRTIVDNNIALATIGRDKIQLGAVNGGISGTTPTGLLAYQTIVTENIADGQITTAKLANAPNGITNAKINIGSVTGGASGGVATGSIALLTIHNDNIRDNTISYTKLGEKQLSNAIKRANIDYNQVGVEEVESSFEYGQNAFNSSGAYVTGKDATPWILATTGTFFPSLGTTYRITLQPKSDGSNAYFHAINSTFNFDCTIYVRIRDRYSVNGAIYRSYLWSYYLRPLLSATISGGGGGTVVFNNTATFVHVQPQTIIDLPTNEGGHYFQAEVFVDNDSANSSRVRLWLDNWVLTVSSI